MPRHFVDSVFVTMTYLNPSVSFHARKLATARFYADQVLPETALGLRQLRAASSSLAAADVMLG